MAKISYPFESVNTGTEQDPVYDRGINSVQERLFNKMRYTNGVFNTVGDSLKVTANNNMTITVGTGGANIEGAMFYMDAPEDIVLEAADPTLNRLDRIVARFDTALGIRSIDVYKKTGVVGTSPVAPALSREPNYYEIALADVYVAKGTTTITTANIKDQRLNVELCGFVLPAMADEINTLDLWTQYEASLNEWYDTVAAALDETMAGHLQNQITTNTDDVTLLKNRMAAEENKVNDFAHGGLGSRSKAEAVSNIGLDPVNITLTPSGGNVPETATYECKYFPALGEVHFNGNVTARPAKDFPANKGALLWTVPPEYSPASTTYLAGYVGDGTAATGYITPQGKISIQPNGKSIGHGWLVGVSGSWFVG